MRRMAHAHEKHLHEAVALAAESIEKGGGPFGAVIVERDRIIARARNRVVDSSDPTAHAEIEAIRRACRQRQTHQLSGCWIYASTEPCPMCLAAIYWARLDGLCFATSRDAAAAAGFDDRFIYTELCRDPDERTLETTQFQMAEAASVLDRWKQKSDKIPY